LKIAEDLEGNLRDYGYISTVSNETAVKILEKLQKQEFEEGEKKKL